MIKRKRVNRLHNRHQLRLEVLENRRLLVASADVSLPAEIRTREVAELSIAGFTDLNLADLDELQLDWGDGRVTSIPVDEIEFPLSRLHSYYAAPTTLTVETIAVMNDSQVLSLSSDVVSLVANSPSVVDRTDEGLTAEIFTNLAAGFDFTVAPDLTRIDPTIAFDFGANSPDYRLGIGGDPFAVRWSGTFTPESNSDHTLYTKTSANDQVRVIVDGATLIDTFGSATAVEQNVSITLAADTPVDLVVEYIAATGVSAIEVGIENNATFKTKLPSDQLAPLQSSADLRTGVLAEEFTTAGLANITALRSASDFIANTPDDGLDLADFSYVDNVARENATRLRTIVTPPVSGEYTFYLAASDNAELWVSQNDESDNSVLAASVDTATPIEGFQNANAGVSDPIYLIAGQEYYVETLQVHDNATEIGHVSVGWTRPDTPTSPPVLIEGDFLQPITPVVSLHAEVSQSFETELLALGTRFVIERTDDLGRDLDVAYTLGGSAENTADYVTLTGIATIPKGETSVTIDVDPIDDGILEGTETVVVRLAADPGYQLSLESERQVTLTIAGEIQDGTQLLPQDFDTFVGSSFYGGQPLNTFTTARETDASLPFVTGTTGDNYLRVDVNSFTNPYDVLVGYGIDALDLPDNVQVFGSLWARSAVAGEEATVGMRIQESGAPYAGSTRSWQVGNEWTSVTFPYVSDFGASTLDRTFDVRLGYQTQIVDIAGFSLYVFPASFDATKLPSDFYNYGGRDADATWRQGARTNTAATRSTPVDITILDSTGVAYASTDITIVPATAGLPIGAAASPERVVPNASPLTQTADSIRYTQILANHFDLLIDSGAAQWSSWLNDSQLPTDFANWVVDQDLPYIGHSVVWGRLDDFPAPATLLSDYDQVVLNQGTAAGETWLENEILNYIATGPAAAFAGSRLGSSDPIVGLWDVINHPIFSDQLWDIVGDDFMLDVIDATRSVVHPDTSLRINESGVLAEFAGANNTPLYDLLTYLDQTAASGRADYDTIGFQGHIVSNELPSIDEAIAQLDRFAVFGRDIQITEFDLDAVYIDRQTQADLTRDMFQVFAANENVSSASLWEFWAEEQWRSGEFADLFSSDWVPYANGQWFLDQLDTAYAPNRLTTDQQGRFKTNIAASQALIYIDGWTDPIPVDLTSQKITIQTPPQFIVNTVLDTPDANPGDGVAVDAGGLTSLRAAIEEANALANSEFGNDQITFDIPGPGPHVIKVSSDLPTIIESVVVDATNQDVNSSSPVVELRNDGNATSGLNIATTGTTIRGLSFTQFDNGLYLNGGGNHHVIENYVGLDTASNALGNGVGIRVTNSANNLIDANIVSGNDGTGIFIQGADSSENVLVNNFVGTDPTGQIAIGNGTTGVLLHSPGNTIGSAGQGNVISGNLGTGLALNIDADDTLVRANKIGTNVDGTIALANSNFGLLVRTNDNQIGGSYLTGLGNLVSGNARHGLVISGAAATNNIVTGNFIGTDLTGESAIANASFGIFVVGASNNAIGGLDTGSMNLISGNNLSGVVIRSGADLNELIGNRIGTNLSGTAAVGNLSVGVAIARTASDNKVLSNLISGNSASGISIVDIGSENNLLQNNLVGTNVDASSTIGNGSFAILVQSGNNTIGGTTEQGNVIGGSTRGVVLSSANATGNTVSGNWIGADPTETANLGMTTGVQISGGATGNVIGPGNTIANNNTGLRLIGNSGNENTVTQSRFVDNVVIGIDIAGLGPTANDVDDADEGTNRSINFPVINGALIDNANLEVTFAVPIATTSATYDLNVEFFVADSFGQGKQYLWTQTYTATDFANGDVVFVAPAVNLIAGDWLTATTTDADGNTSEFALRVAIKMGNREEWLAR